jgi:3-oxoacyl-[acyl-carrier protein] reductase
MALRFAGKHCAVIGATGVIGSHIARAFAANGALVSSFGRTALEAQPKLEAEMTPYTPTPGAEHLPAKHQFVPLNILDHQDIDRVFKGRDATTGDVPPQVDILVNCAGISQDSFLKMASNEHLKDIIDTNLTASLLLCKVVKMQKAGCIINVSSLMATKGAVGAVAYAASKAGILGQSTSHLRHNRPVSLL